jgi:hypothetical protein
MSPTRVTDGLTSRHNLTLLLLEVWAIKAFPAEVSMTPCTRAALLALTCGFAPVLSASTAGAAVVNMSVTFSPNDADTVPLVIIPGLTLETNTFEGVFTPAAMGIGDTLNVNYSFGGKAIAFGGNGGNPEGFQLQFAKRFGPAGQIDNVVATLTGVTGQLLLANPVFPSNAGTPECAAACFLVDISGNLTNTGFSFTGGTFSFRIIEGVSLLPTTPIFFRGWIRHFQ